jgi:predicted transcriptional regulator of viral defense system
VRNYVSTKLTKLLQSGLKVFTLDDMGVIWGQRDRAATRQSARDYASRGELIRIKQGVYALPHEGIDKFSIANKLLVPSYVTGLSILVDAGLSYQYSERVFCVALYNKTYKVQGRSYVYSQVKAPVLFNTVGLVNESGRCRASVERTITDLLYLNKGSYPFERIDKVDWELLENCALIYDRPFVVNAVNALRDTYA